MGVRSHPWWAIGVGTYLDITSWVWVVEALPVYDNVSVAALTSLAS